ncbi:MAG: hypothetical protein U0836_09135 [Pirellulales bacterium]
MCPWPALWQDDARDNPPVREVPDAVVERTMAWLPPGVRIVVQFMRLTPATWT